MSQRGVDVAELRRALPNYEIGELLGAGAMGEVIAAHHVKLDREVAVKRLPPAFTYDEGVRERFGEEARLLASLSHPHIVPVYDYVDGEGLCLLVMQALPGGTVWERFTTEGITMAAACAIAIATCAGLQHAHDRRVLHRDIKPENLMFDDEGAVVVTDFGIAAVLGGDRTLATLDGQILGTPAYMAPEQATAGVVGPAADVYAVGTMLYELLAGELPFVETGDALDLLRRRLDEAPRPLLDVAPDVPPGLAAVVMRSLARHPRDRYQSAEDLGVAVALAAAEAWGPAWLDRAEVQLRTVDAVGVAARGTGPAGPPSGGTPSPDAEEVAPPLRSPGPAGSSPAGSPSVRPTRTEPAATTDLRAVDPREVVPVAELLTPPPVPVAAIVVSAIAALLLLVLAVSGVGTADGTSGSLDAADVTVDGIPLSERLPVQADLADPVVVGVTNLPDGADRARLTMTAVGIAGTGSDTASLEPGAGGAQATLWAQAAQVVTSGHQTAHVDLLDADGNTVGTISFPVAVSQPAYASFSGLLALALLLGAVAYAVSTSKPLRLGRRRPSAFVGMAAIGAFAGAGVAFASWSLLGGEPTVPSLVAAVVLGSVAFGAAGWAMFQLGRRRRLLAALERARAAAPPATPPGPRRSADTVIGQR